MPGDLETNSVASSTIDSQNYAIPVPEEISSDSDSEQSSSLDSIESASGDLSGHEGTEQLLSSLMNSTTTSLTALDMNKNEPVFDVAAYIIQSLRQAIDSADFAETLALQTKTSAAINSKSIELKQLIDDAAETVPRLQDKLNKAAKMADQIRAQLRQSRTKIKLLNDAMRVSHPIELSQARDTVLERVSTTSTDGH